MTILSKTSSRPKVLYTPDLPLFFLHHTNSNMTTSVFLYSDSNPFQISKELTQFDPKCMLDVPADHTFAAAKTLFELVSERAKNNAAPNKVPTASYILLFSTLLRPLDKGLRIDGVIRVLAKAASEQRETLKKYGSVHYYVPIATDIPNYSGYLKLSKHVVMRTATSNSTLIDASFFSLEHDSKAQEHAKFSDILPLEYSNQHLSTVYECYTALLSSVTVSEMSFRIKNTYMEPDKIARVLPATCHIPINSLTHHALVTFIHIAESVFEISTIPVDIWSYLCALQNVLTVELSRGLSQQVSNHFAKLQLECPSTLKATLFPTPIASAISRYLELLSLRSFLLELIKEPVDNSGCSDQPIVLDTLARLYISPKILAEIVTNNSAVSSFHHLIYNLPESVDPNLSRMFTTSQKVKLQSVVAFGDSTRALPSIIPQSFVQLLIECPSLEITEQDILDTIFGAVESLVFVDSSPSGRLASINHHRTLLYGLATFSPYMSKNVKGILDAIKQSVTVRKVNSTDLIYFCDTKSNTHVHIPHTGLFDWLQSRADVGYWISDTNPELGLNTSSATQHEFAQRLFSCLARLTSIPPSLCSVLADFCDKSVIVSSFNARHETQKKNPNFDATLHVLDTVYKKYGVAAGEAIKGVPKPYNVATFKKKASSRPSAKKAASPQPEDTGDKLNVGRLNRALSKKRDASQNTNAPSTKKTCPS